ncbi:MAG: SpoIIE family protein phosphatase [Desulfovibrio sp.]|uniref:SpoIIE family protein phosphatase n=1 Tax=Desulfovibrio sp. 7SRBS1 TaxID=3378064 RepID=UPI003B3C272D
MKFRWKLLFLLLVLSLGPMFVLHQGGVKSLKGLTTKIIGEIRNSLTSNAEARLALYVTDTAALLGTRGDVLEVGMYFLTHAATGMIEAGEIPGLTGPPPTVGDFREDRVNIPLQKHPDYYRTRPSGRRVDLDISFAAPSIRFAQGMSKQQRERVALEASRIQPLFFQVQDATKSGVLWTQITLPNGTLFTYPGTGAFPDDYDPRTTEWYKSLLENDREWSMPFYDPATRRPVLAFSKRILSSSGKLLGVATFVLSLDTMIAKNSADNSELVPDANFYLVYADRERLRVTGQWALRILSGREFSDSRAKNWRSPLAPEWLESSDRRTFYSLVESVLSNESKTFRMPYRNKDSLWVVGHLRDNGTVALIGIVPFEHILKPAMAAEEWIHQTVDSQFSLMRYTFMVVILLVLGAAFLFSRSVTRPLEALGCGARKLAKGDFSVRLKASSRDEFGEMGRMFNAVVPQLEENVRVRQTMQLAREVQQNLLPDAPPSIPGVDIAASSIYSDATGGDYFDYLCFHDRCGQRVSILVGDVSGHGVPAALLMTTARALIRQRAALPGEIDAIVTDVNHELTKDVYKTGRFMTLFYLDVDVAASTANWVRAGHDPIPVYNPATDSFRELNGSGLPLGVLEDFVYERYTTTLQPGEIVAIGTDGIWESRNNRDEMFGKARFREVIRTYHDAPAKVIVAKVIEKVREFTGRHGFEDDVTLAVLKIDLPFDLGEQG